MDPQELEALRRDALRYKWIRSHANDDYADLIPDSPDQRAWDALLDCTTGEALDAAIDAAIDPPVEPPCPRCEGSGEIEVDQIVVGTADQSYRDTVQCPNCNGDGILISPP